MTGSAATLTVEGIDKHFGDLHAVDALSLSIAQGETFGLLGPNGAGKTTSISIICGLLDADAGTVTVGGTPITVGSTRGRERIGYVPQELAIYEELTGEDNLRFFAGLYGIRGERARKRIDAVLEIVALGDRRRDKAREYSGGMQRRLNIAAGMLHEPQLLILDEPTVGVDPQSRNAILDAVDALSNEGMSVLYTTHYMEEAERLCDRIGIMDHGRLLACGTRRELIASVGQHDVIALSLLTGQEQAAELLGGHDGVVDVSVDADERVECVVDRAATRLPRLLDALADAGLIVQNVELREPNLDAVFLHLTGTALRD